MGWHKIRDTSTKIKTFLLFENLKYISYTYLISPKVEVCDMITTQPNSNIQNNR